MNNPFITEKCTLEEAKKLIEVGLPLMEGNPKVQWSEIEDKAGSDVGYGRGWLIVRYAYLQKHEPDVLVPTSELLSKAFKEAEASGNSGTYDERRVLSEIAVQLRDVHMLSWGEIAVRMGIPESRVRRAYRFTGGKKDLGLRIGKGGRFAWDDGSLYTENRKKEGAYIKTDKVGKPRIEELLNFKPKEGSTTDQARKQAITRLLKIQDLLNDGATPQAQRDAQKPKFDALLLKYGITLRDLAVARAAKEGKRGRAA